MLYISFVFTHLKYYTADTIPFAINGNKWIKEEKILILVFYMAASHFLYS